MAVFDVPNKFSSDVEALWSNSDSGILIRISNDSLPTLDDSNIDIQSVMAMANEPNGSWRRNMRMVIEAA